MRALAMACFLLISTWAAAEVKQVDSHWISFQSEKSLGTPVMIYESTQNPQLHLYRMDEPVTKSTPTAIAGYCDYLNSRYRSGGDRSRQFQPIRLGSHDVCQVSYRSAQQSSLQYIFFSPNPSQARKIVTLSWNGTVAKHSEAESGIKSLAALLLEGK